VAGRAIVCTYPQIDAFGAVLSAIDREIDMVAVSRYQTISRNSALPLASVIGGVWARISRRAKPIS
jgi:hypothetical protein